MNKLSGFGKKRYVHALIYATWLACAATSLGYAQESISDNKQTTTDIGFSPIKSLWAAIGKLGRLFHFESKGHAHETDLGGSALISQVRGGANHLPLAKQVALKLSKDKKFYFENQYTQVSKVEVKLPWGSSSTTYVKKPMDSTMADPVVQSLLEQVGSNHDLTQFEIQAPEPAIVPKTVVVPEQTSEEAEVATQLMSDLRQVPFAFLSEKTVNVAKNEYTTPVTDIDSGSLALTPDEELVAVQKPNALPGKVLPGALHKRPDEAMIEKLEFNQANVLDVARALADVSGLNFVATEEAAKKNVTVFLQKISVKHALDAITKNSGLWYRQDKDSKTFRIMTTDEYQKDLVVYREDITKVFNLLHPNPVNVATAIRDLFGPRVIISYGANFDDFFTGQFNTGGGRGGVGVGSGRGGVGGVGVGGVGGGVGVGGGLGGGLGGVGGGLGGLGGGQAGLRTPITNGFNQGGNLGGVNGALQYNPGGIGGSGALANGAITERLTADQIIKLESQLDENGNQVGSDAARGISKAQQLIYVTANRQQNMLIVRTSDSVAVKEIEILVKALDKPTAQVLLEMRILEVDVGDAYTQLFSFGKVTSNGKQGYLARESNLADSGKFVYTFVDSLINAKLELLQTNNKVRTISSPVLMASNNRTSRLFIGEERLLIRGATLTDPVLGTNGQVVTPGRITYETELRNVGNTLNITPKINADGTVSLGVFQDTSTVDAGAIPFPPLIANNGQVFNFNVDSVQTSNIEGVVVAKDNLTVAIGGLIRSSARKNESKIPVLGDIPVLGNLFKDIDQANSRSELVLLITPHIISNPNDSEEVSRDAVEPLTNEEW